MAKKAAAMAERTRLEEPGKCAACGKGFTEENPSFIEDPKGSGQVFHPHECYASWIARGPLEAELPPNTSSQIDAQEQEHLVHA